jgi:hypothetical protein
MFGIKSDGNNQVKTVKLPGPGEISSLVKTFMINNLKVDADAPNFLQAVLKPVGRKEDKCFEIRIFDPDEAMAIEYNVKDYTSLDSAPQLIFYEGNYSEKSKQCTLQKKRRPDFNIDLFSEDKILKDIEAIKEPGNSLFFFTSSGPSSGGPLGRGAAIIVLQSAQPGKKPCYSIYSSNVIDMKPVDKKVPVFESSSARDIAKWAKTMHIKRFC